MVSADSDAVLLPVGVPNQVLHRQLRELSIEVVSEFILLAAGAALREALGPLPV